MDGAIVGLFGNEPKCASVSAYCELLGLYAGLVVVGLVVGSTVELFGNRPDRKAPVR